MKKLTKSDVRNLLTSNKNALVYVSPLIRDENKAAELLKKIQSKIDGGLQIECTRRSYASNTSSLAFIDEKTNEISYLYMNSWTSAMEYKNFIILVNKIKATATKRPQIKFMVYKVE